MIAAQETEKRTPANDQGGRPRERLSPRRGEKSPPAMAVHYVDHPSFSLPGTEQELWGSDRLEIHVSPYRPLPAYPEEAAQRPRSRSALTPMEEKTLFLRYNYAKYRVSKVARSAERRRTAGLAQQEKLWRARARQTLEQIVHANLALVPAMAKGSRRAGGVEFGDLVSEGQMAILRCIEHFDVSRGFKFSTYACRSVLACFHRLGAKERRYRQHVPVQFEPQMQQDDYGQRRHAEQLSFAVASVREAVLRNRADLTDLERTVLLGRFPVGSEAPPLTLSQIGKLVGLSNERVRQIEGASLLKVRSSLERHLVA